MLSSAFNLLIKPHFPSLAHPPSLLKTWSASLGTLSSRTPLSISLSHSACLNQFFHIFPGFLSIMFVSIPTLVFSLFYLQDLFLCNVSVCMLFLSLPSLPCPYFFDQPLTFSSCLPVLSRVRDFPSLFWASLLPSSLFYFILPFHQGQWGVPCSSLTDSSPRTVRRSFSLL